MTDRKPLALATILPGVPDWTMAVFPATEVPIGTELFTHAKNSRLQLQVEVANENAQHWKKKLQEANERNREGRTAARLYVALRDGGFLDHLVQVHPCDEGKRLQLIDEAVKRITNTQ